MMSKNGSAANGEKHITDHLLVASDRWHDFYQGTAEELVNAGLAGTHELPGQPGGPKVQVTIKSETPGSHSSDPGARIIRKKGRQRYEIKVAISAEEHARRYALETQHREKAAAATRALQLRCEIEANIRAVGIHKEELSWPDFQLAQKARIGLASAIEIHERWKAGAIAELATLTTEIPRDPAARSLTLVYSAGRTPT